MDSLDKMACIVVCCIFICFTIVCVTIRLTDNGSSEETNPLYKLEAIDKGQFNNHSYLLFREWTHDPDCPYCEEKLTKLLDKYIIKHLPIGIDNNHELGIMLTNTKPNIPYVHGIPAQQNSNDPPWIHMEYPVAVIEGLTEEERNKWFPINSSNSIVITNPLSISEAYY